MLVEAARAALYGAATRVSAATRAIARAPLAVVVVAVVGAACSAWASEAPGASQEDCPYVPGGKAVHREHQSCGATGECFSESSVEIGPLLLVGKAADVDVRCAPGSVTLSEDGARRGSLKLLWDATRGAFTIDRAVDAALARLRRAPPLEAATWVDAEALARTLAWVPGLAGSRLGEASLLLASAQLARGETGSANATLVEYAAALSAPAMADRVAELNTRIERARFASAPLHGADARRIGTTPSLPRVPPFPDATAFWRGSAVCVVQNDAPDRMRCYDVEAGRWGALEPTARPLSLSQAGGGAACGHMETFSATPSADGGGCGPFERSELVGVAPGPVALLERGGRIVTWTAAGEMPVSAPEATAIAARTAGTRLLQGGAMLLAGGVRYRTVGDARTEWALLGPEAATAWASVPGLSSPDQRWVLAFSPTGKRSQTALWVMKVAASESR
jgi:hypothetical protein